MKPAVDLFITTKKYIQINFSYNLFYFFPLTIKTLFFKASRSTDSIFSTNIVNNKL